jgi:hypothetical protein
MIVMLVEATSVDQLVDRLRKGKYRSSNDVRAKSKWLNVQIFFISLIYLPQCIRRLQKTMTLLQVHKRCP